MKYQNRITINQSICHGKPCIRGMRWPVEAVLDLLVSEMSIEEILSDHPELEKEDIMASLEYARLLVSGKSVEIAAYHPMRSESRIKERLHIFSTILLSLHNSKTCS